MLTVTSRKIQSLVLERLLFLFLFLFFFLLLIFLPTFLSFLFSSFFLSFFLLFYLFLLNVSRSTSTSLGHDDISYTFLSPSTLAIAKIGFNEIEISITRSSLARAKKRILIFPSIDQTTTNFPDSVRNEFISLHSGRGVNHTTLPRLIV